MGELQTEKSVTSVSKNLNKDWELTIGLSRECPVFRFNKEEPFVKRTDTDLIDHKYSTKYCTGSTFEGNCNALGFQGYGQYTYPHGVRYEGNFRYGKFHGKGSLIYPLGQIVNGIWKNGKLIKHLIRNSDGLTHTTPWKYCKAPDRRFQTERLEGLQAPGEEYLTNMQPTKVLQTHCYDTVDGYFDAKEKCVLKDTLIYVKDGLDTYEYQQKPEILRVCTREEDEIITNCYRKAEDENVGYCPGLYEIWTTGREKELEAIHKKLTETSAIGQSISSITLQDTNGSDD